MLFVRVWIFFSLLKDTATGEEVPEGGNWLGENLSGGACPLFSLSLKTGENEGRAAPDMTGEYTKQNRGEAWLEVLPRCNGQIEKSESRLQCHMLTHKMNV